MAKDRQQICVACQHWTPGTGVTIALNPGYCSLLRTAKMNTGSCPSWEGHHLPDDGVLVCSFTRFSYNDFIQAMQLVEAELDGVDGLTMGEEIDELITFMAEFLLNGSELNTIIAALVVALRTGQVLGQLYEKELTHAASLS